MEFRGCKVGLRGVTGPGECGGCSWTERQKSFARSGKIIPMALLQSGKQGAGGVNRLKESSIAPHKYGMR